MTPSEQTIRERFINDINHSFNVIAPAGSGKTYAIVRRVENLVRKTDRKIALLTYTNKAAEEMRVRLDGLLSNTIYDSDRVFVGTIHSFCTELIGRYASAWNIQMPLEVIEQADDIFSEYLSDVGNPLRGLPDEIVERFSKHFEMFGWGLLEKVLVEPVAIEEFLEPPLLNLEQVLAYPLKGNSGIELRNMKLWAQRFVNNGGWESNLQAPSVPETKKAKELYDEVFDEYTQWKSQQGLLYAKWWAWDFKQWRIKRSLVTFDDQISIVDENLQPGESWAVVLDEAQDTSPSQLRIMEKVADRSNGFLDFSLVGDPQQNIYSSRAPLDFYQQTVERLQNKENVETITFQTTFRCDEAVVEWSNAVGANLLDGSPSQAAYVPLSLRDEAGVGNVGKWVLGDDDFPDEPKEKRVAAFVASKIKQQISDFTHTHRIAVLAPRNRWVEEYSNAFKKEGIPHQVNIKDMNGPAARILKSVAHLMSYPGDCFELVGLLREIFPIDDIILSRTLRENRSAFDLSSKQQSLSHPLLNESLNLLKQAWQRARQVHLSMALRTFCEQIGLRNKIASMEGVAGEGLLDEYDRVLTAMIVASVSATDMSQLAQMSIADTQEVKPGYIQILTMHKAKGLEWDVVILPNMHRMIRPAPPSYPTLVENGGKEMLAYSKDQVDRAQKNRMADLENQRLLYVAYTRARSCLIMVDDESVYGMLDSSAAKLSGFDGTNQAVWEGLPDNIEIPPLSGRETRTIETSINPWEILNERTIERIVPSQEVEHDENYESKTEGGTLYGSDWHDAWAELPEGLGESRIKENLLARAQRFEKNKRGIAEIEKLFATPTLKELLANPFWTEVSLLVKTDDGVMEGRLDVVAQTAENLWIVDWKTDHSSPAQIWESYKNQLHSYQTGLEKLEGKPVRASLYSTVHAVWMESDGHGGFVEL